MANDVLEAAGGSLKKDVVRKALALEDIDLRRTDLNASGDGVLTSEEISDYHYAVFEDPSINLPREAWGGALFEEFGGTGSWVKVAQSGDLSDVDMIAVTDAYYNDSTLDGVNARTASFYLLSAGIINPPRTYYYWQRQ